MKQSAALILTVLIAALSASLVSAQATATCELVSLFDGWAAVSPSGAANGAVFGTLVNLSSQPDTLLSVGGDAAEAIEIHETTMDASGVMKMRPIDGGLEIPAHGYAELKPGAIHIMLIGLRQPLEVGGTVSLALHFERAGAVTVTLPIRDRMAMSDATAMPSMEMEGMNMSTPMALPSDEAWPENCRGVYVVDPWARPNIPGAPNSAAYALVLNLTQADETLIGAQTSVAQTELDSMVMGSNNVMVMRPVEGGIVIPAGGTALLQPGGLHVMLMNLTSDLRVGSSFELILQFANSGDQTVRVPIRELVDDSGLAGM